MRIMFLHSLFVAFLLFTQQPLNAQASVEQWDIFELALKAPTNGNPFLDVEFSAQFSQDTTVIKIEGFYDGDQTFRLRFMPPRQGRWRYLTQSTVKELNGQSGAFEVVKPAARNHGPVHVTNTFHFAYTDGTPYKPLGTTCYAWIHQPAQLQEQTLQTLAASPFNKLRFCVFPKRYSWNSNEPPLYPFEGTAPRSWDFTRFNPRFFQHLEQRLRDLQKIGMEADLILFHPYDEGHWGFDRMDAATDERYLKYLVRRLACFRNVWWSLANEFDFMTEKTDENWERFGPIVTAADPYRHLLSIHNGKRLFNQNVPWLSHASIQNGSAVEDAARAVLYRDAFRKPIVYDEVKYEGNLPKRWGNLSAEQMVLRFWYGTIAGTYVTHGETYLSPDEVIWWSKGGTLKGQSPPRLAFLRQVLEASPPAGIEPIDKWQNPEYGGQPAEYYLIYFGTNQPTSWEFKLPTPPQTFGKPLIEGMQFRAEVLDTWNMTTTPVEKVFTVVKKSDYFLGDNSGSSIALPGKPYMAIRIQRVVQ